MKISPETHKPQSSVETNSSQEHHCVTGNVIGSPHPISCRPIYFLNFLTVLDFYDVPLDCNRPKPSTLQVFVAVKISESAKVWPKCKLIEFLGPSKCVVRDFSYVKSVKR